MYLQPRIPSAAAETRISGGLVRPAIIAYAIYATVLLRFGDPQPYL
jgi:hypothetical protein